MSVLTWIGIVASNVGSFLLGMWVMRRLVRRLLSAVDHQNSCQAGAPSHHATRSVIMRTTVRAFVIFLVSFLIFGVGVRVGFEILANKVDCFNDYANDLADSLEPRQKASEELQQADLDQDLAIVDLLTPGDNDADYRALLEASAAKVAKQDDLSTQRDAKPYPDPPREVCR